MKAFTFREKAQQRVGCLLRIKERLWINKEKRYELEGGRVCLLLGADVFTSGYHCTVKMRGAWVDSLQIVTCVLILLIDGVPKRVFANEKSIHFLT